MVAALLSPLFQLLPLDAPCLCSVFPLHASLIITLSASLALGKRKALISQVFHSGHYQIPARARMVAVRSKPNHKFESYDEPRPGNHIFWERSWRVEWHNLFMFSRQHESAIRPFLPWSKKAVLDAHRAYL